MHRRARRAVLSATGLMAGLLAGVSGMASAQAQPALGGTISIACGDITGLKAAITAADAGTGPSTILLATGCVYTLTTVAATGSFGPDGLPIITNVVTLIGHATTIQRDTIAPGFRILEVASGGDLTVQGITARNGIAEGGGCYLVGGGGTLNLQHSVVTDCSAGGGGGIFLEGTDAARTYHGAGAIHADGVSTANIHDSSLSDNSAEEGGAIFSAAGSAVKLVSDYLAENLAVAGGAIFTDGLELFVGASDLTRNHASEEGGGIFNDDALMYVAGSKLELNSAGSKGGAISNYALTFLQNSQVDGNLAPTGGGIWLGGGAAVALSSQITDNKVGNCQPYASVPGCLS